VPSVNSTILKELLPDAELILYPGRRHCFFMEESKMFNRIAVQFFNAAEKA